MAMRMCAASDGDPRSARDAGRPMPIRIDIRGCDGARGGEKDNTFSHQFRAHRQRVGQEMPRRSST
eukprot:2932569-Heterocapsa_arctica.AAC.1